MLWHGCQLRYYSIDFFPWPCLYIWREVNLHKVNFYWQENNFIYTYMPGNSRTERKSLIDMVRRVLVKRCTDPSYFKRHNFKRFTFKKIKVSNRKTLISIVNRAIEQTEKENPQFIILLFYLSQYYFVIFSWKNEEFYLWEKKRWVIGSYKKKYHFLNMFYSTLTCLTCWSNI